MMSSEILLNDRARLGGSPAEVLADVNEELCRNKPSCMFVTLWLGILELSTGRLSCSFKGDAHRFDDLTMRCVIYRGSPQ